MYCYIVSAFTDANATPGNKLEAIFYELVICLSIGYRGLIKAPMSYIRPAGAIGPGLGLRGGQNHTHSPTHLLSTGPLW